MSLQESVPLLSLSWRWAMQVAELPGYLFRPAPSSRERIILEKQHTLEKHGIPGSVIRADNSFCLLLQRSGWLSEKEQGTFA